MGLIIMIQNFFLILPTAVCTKIRLTQSVAKLSEFTPKKFSVDCLARRWPWNATQLLIIITSGTKLAEKERVKRDTVYQSKLSGLHQD